MSLTGAEFFPDLYARFDAPIAALDCGQKCAPYNERGVPFCCDIRHAVPAAYTEEWRYLSEHSDLWRVWREDEKLLKQTPPNQTLIQCLGHHACRRQYRAVTCRAFPFFPYLSRERQFIGLSYYWEYEDRCWVISNLAAVTQAYLAKFIAAYESLFEAVPEEAETFFHHSRRMRRRFGQLRRAIPLLHRNGNAYKITPGNGRMRRVPAESLPRFGPYRVAARLRFPDEWEPPGRKITIL
jgi:hypothetical protein